MIVAIKESFYCPNCGSLGWFLDLYCLVLEVAVDRRLVAATIGTDSEGVFEIRSKSDLSSTTKSADLWKEDPTDLSGYFEN